MCGIIGGVSITPFADRRWLTGGRDAMFHRGPDSAGEWWSSDGRVGLAHRRLAIIDLSAAGHQPMCLGGDEFVIVFNGEIYNFAELKIELSRRGYAFSTNTDTEVVLAAFREWGVECVTKLNGMFAFAVYDSRGKRIFLTRDRSGEKPLFYLLRDGELRFSSELKGLLADPLVPRVASREAVDCYLALGYVPGSACVLSGFNKLKAAHSMVFNLETGEARVWPYWSPPIFSPLTAAHDDQALEIELEDLLQRAVRRQLVADVPVGILLSGGVDSSVIVALAARAGAELRTFTVGFPGFGGHDESAHARLIANHFGTVHTELTASEIKADLLHLLARQFDEPVNDSSMIPTALVSELVSKHCKVALGGDGGDELFGGYAHYSRLEKLSKLAGIIPREVRAMLAAAAETILPVGFKGRNWLRGLAVDFNSGVPLIATYFDRTSRAKLVNRFSSWPIVAEDRLSGQFSFCGDMVQRATRMDYSCYLAEDILVKVDRASMLHSLEIRAPFLDRDVVEFAFGRVPSRLKATRNGKKILLKRLTSRLLPAAFDRERKQGFSIPLAAWLARGEFRDLFLDVLTDPSCIFERKSIDSLIAGQDRGRANSERLFALVLFELWRKNYSVSIS
jgi:asparagine synthase (glutamine-hydrolysing)